MAANEKTGTLEQVLGRLGNTAPPPDLGRLAGILREIQRSTGSTPKRRRIRWLTWLMLGAAISAAAAVGRYWAHTTPDKSAIIPATVQTDSGASEEGGAHPPRVDGKQQRTEAGVGTNPNGRSPAKHDALIYLR